MKKLALALALVLVAAVGCCPVPLKSFEQLEATREMVKKSQLQYIEKDASLKEKDKDDWRKLWESDDRNFAAIKKAHE